MAHPTDTFRYLQQLDRAFLSCGYATDLQRVDVLHNGIYIITRITGDIFDATEHYVDLETHIIPASTTYNMCALIKDTNLDYYPYTKDDELREINTHLDESIDYLPIPAVKLARIISSQCHKLGIKPSRVEDLI